MEKNIKLREYFEDVAMKKRSMITKYTSLSGLYSSQKNEGSIWFESALEKDFISILEAHPFVTKFIEQPIEIEYNSDIKTQIYTPDFLVYFHSKSQKPWLCEIKMKDDLRKNFWKYKPKFKAANKFASIEGWEFKIISEDYIRTDLLFNSKFLERYTQAGVDLGCFDLVLNRIQNLNITSPKEIIISFSDAAPEIKDRLIYAMWYAVRMNYIDFDWSFKLTVDTEIWYNYDRRISN